MKGDGKTHEQHLGQLGNAGRNDLLDNGRHGAGTWRRCGSQIPVDSASCWKSRANFAVQSVCEFLCVCGFHNRIEQHVRFRHDDFSQRLSNAAGDRDAEPGSDCGYRSERIHRSTGPDQQFGATDLNQSKSIDGAGHSQHDERRDRNLQHCRVGACHCGEQRQGSGSKGERLLCRCKTQRCLKRNEVRSSVAKHLLCAVIQCSQTAASSAWESQRTCRSPGGARGGQFA